MQTNFYIFRHGLTLPVKRHLQYGPDNFTVDILPEARVAIEGIGNYLKEIPADAFLVSPYKRCQETADIVSIIIGKEYLIDQRLEEMHDLESDQSMKERVNSLLTEIEGKGYQHVFICTHGAIIAMLTYILTQDTEHFDFMNFPETGTLTVIKDGKAEIINFNIQ